MRTLSPAKAIAAWLPERWQAELKRLHFARQIRRARFLTNEPEYKILHELVRPGDWVIDIGANVGHYTQRLSALVGVHGRVIAFEPVPATFSLLAANAALFAHPNVSLINAAASDKLDVVGMSMPNFATGLANYYEAHLVSDSSGPLSVLTMPVDSLNIEHRIALVKIDAEGHEASVLAGMRTLIKKHRPVLIVETSSAQIIDDLTAEGYGSVRLPGSPNILFKPRA